MAYFPFFIDISDKEGLIVGGGTVALQKVEKLLPYGPRLTVAAPEICPALTAVKELTLLRQPFSAPLLKDKFFVIAATDSRELNREIAAMCQERRILMNAVDDREVCSFLFPALVQEEPLSIGISTGGASPSAAVYLKKQIAALLPERFGELLAYLDSQRDMVKETLTEERLRAVFFSWLFDVCLERGSPLNEWELQESLARFLQKGRNNG